MGSRADRLRLFCALRLPDPVLDDLVAWQEGVFAGVPGIRVVPRQNLHVTLAFLGSRPSEEVPAIVGALRGAANGAAEVELSPGRYRETRSVGMHVFEDVHGGASTLAEALFDRLESLGVYEREQRTWLPHVTVIRFQQPPRLRPREPAIGRFSPSDAALYTSVLRPGGAQYEVLESVALGG